MYNENNKQIILNSFYNSCGSGWVVSYSWYFEVLGNCH